MGEKRSVGYLEVTLFLVGLFFLVNARRDITGAVIGTQYVSSNLSLMLGIVFISISIIFFVKGDLEEKLEDHRHWKLYQFNKPFMMAEDVKKGYLKRKKLENNLTPIQERIERSVSGGKLIKKPYEEHTYEEKFYSGHASQGGRIIDVDSHIINKKKHSRKFFDRIKNIWNKGKLEHFNKLADGWYIWVVDGGGNFVIGSRNPENKYAFEHILHKSKLPHPVLAKGERVYGAGDVFIEKGLVKEYNTASGHYFDRRDWQGFNKQGKEVFSYFRKKVGWREVKGGAKYGIKHDFKGDSINY